MVREGEAEAKGGAVVGAGDVVAPFVEGHRGC